MSRTLPTRATLPAVFGIAYATGFSGAVVPGSLLAVVVKETLLVGWKAGPVMMIGHALLELVAAILLTTGLIVFARARGVQGAIGLLGGAVLVYLGVATCQVSGGEAAAALTAAGAHGAGVSRGEGWLALIALGATMSMVNPYWWLWWATIGPAHIGWATARGRTASGVYFVGHILADVTWYSAVSIALAAGRTLLSPAILTGIYIGAGVFLIGMGALFVVFGGRKLRSRTGAAVGKAG
jgi:threonine/homoserine/homoserine lactone efflux protein